MELLSAPLMRKPAGSTAATLDLLPGSQGRCGAEAPRHLPFSPSAPAKSYQSGDAGGPSSPSCAPAALLSLSLRSRLFLPRLRSCVPAPAAVCSWPLPATGICPLERAYSSGTPRVRAPPALGSGGGDRAGSAAFSPGGGISRRVILRQSGPRILAEPHPRPSAGLWPLSLPRGSPGSSA